MTENANKESEQKLDELKRALVEARTKFATLFRKEALKTSIRDRARKEHEDTVIGGRLDTPVAHARAAYQYALNEYLRAINDSHGHDAERRERAKEAEELIRDKWRIMFMAAFGRTLGKSEWVRSAMQGVLKGAEWVGTHKKETAALIALSALILTLGGAAAVATLSIATLQAALPYAAYGGSVAVGAGVAVPLGLMLRQWVEAGDKKYETKLLADKSLNDTEVGEKMAVRRRNSKFLIFIATLITGFGVRTGVKDALLSIDLPSLKSGLSMEAKASPSHTETLPGGEISKEEAIFINRTMAPHDDMLARYRANIDAIERDRAGYLQRAIAAGRSEKDAVISFDLSLALLKGTAAEYETAVRVARGQLEFVAQKPFDPRYPHMLEDEARLRIVDIRNAASRLRAHYQYVADMARTGKVPSQFVEGKLDVPQEKDGLVQAAFTSEEGSTVSEGSAAELIARAPKNVVEYLQEVLGRLDTNTIPQAAELDAEIKRLLALDRSALNATQSSSLDQTIAGMKAKLGAFEGAYGKINDTGRSILKQSVESGQGPEWLTAHQAEINTTLDPLKADVERLAAECSTDAARVKELYPIDLPNTPRLTGAELTDVAYQPPQTIAGVRFYDMLNAPEDIRRFIRTELIENADPRVHWTVGTCSGPGSMLIYVGWQNGLAKLFTDGPGPKIIEESLTPTQVEKWIIGHGCGVGGGLVT